MKSTKKRLFIVALITSLATLVPTGAAYAETNETNAIGYADPSWDFWASVSSLDQANGELHGGSDCSAKLEQQGACSKEIVVEMYASTPTIATAAQIAADGNLVNSEGVTLAEAAATTTAAIYIRTWYQTMSGLFWITWWEKHNGRIYYQPGVNAGVWSTTSRYGYLGYHHCGLGGGTGFDVQVKYCFTERRYDLSWDPISEWDYFKVQAFVRGSPISATHDMHMNAYPSGAIYYHW